MTTLASFDDMLNEHLDYDLMMAEYKERCWLINNVEKDQTWKNGTLVVPFEGAQASNITMGSLTAENDIGEDEFVRGEVSGYKEMWGALKFHSRDLAQNLPESAKKKGLINKYSFLKILPDRIERFLREMKDSCSTMLLASSNLAKLTADSTANDGVVTVDRPDRLRIGQKLVVDDDNSTQISCYVKTINVNLKQAVFVTARGGSTVVDFSSNQMTTAQNAKIYVPGAEDSSKAFTSLKSQLLSAANGGSANLFGQSKLAYPYLQSINISGASVTATNILDEIFDAWIEICTLGQGYASEVVMSWKHIGSVFKLLEAGSGGFRHVSTKASPYGYTEVVVGGVQGDLKLVGVREMDDDAIFFLDKTSFKLHTNGFFEREYDPDGKGWYTVRATTGYFYITDIRFYGELVLHAPSRCGVMYGVSY